MLKNVGLVLVIWHIEMTMENSPNSLIFLDVEVGPLQEFMYFHKGFI